MRNKQRNKRQESDFTFPKPKSVEEHGPEPAFVMLGFFTSIVLMCYGLFFVFRSSPSDQGKPGSTPPTEVKRSDYSLQASHATELETKEIFGLLATSFELVNDSNTSQAGLLNKRFELVEQLESRELTSKEKYKTQLIKLDTLNAIHFDIFNQNSRIEDYDIPLQHTLVQELGELKASRETQISSLADYVLFQSNCLQKLSRIVGGESGQIQPLAAYVIRFMEKYSQERSAIAIANMVVMNGIHRFELNDAKQLVRAIEKESLKESFKEELSPTVSEFSDEIAIRESKLRDLFKDKWINGESGQRTLLAVCDKLLDSPKSGMRILGEVDHVAYWFEQEGRYTQATRLYRKMLESAKTFSRQPVVQMATELAKDGITRSELVGAQIEWNFDNSPKKQPFKKLSKKHFEGKVVVVIFWSVFDPNSIRELQALHLQSSIWNSKEVVGLAIHVDEKQSDLGQVIDIAKTLTRFDFVNDDLKDAKYNSIIAQCPGKRVPRFMLVDHTGKVIDINTPASSIESEVSFLVRQR